MEKVNALSKIPAFRLAYLNNYILQLQKEWNKDHLILCPEKSNKQQLQKKFLKVEGRKKKWRKKKSEIKYFSQINEMSRETVKSALLRF